MKSEGKLWVLFDSANNKKTKPLSIVQTQMLLLSLKVSTLHSYFIWTLGWEEWRPLAEFLSSNQKFFVQAQPPEPLLNRQKQEAPKISQNDRAERRHVKEATLEETVSGVNRFTQIVPAESLEQKVDYGYYYNEFNGDDLTLSGLPEKAPVEILVSRSEVGSPKDRRRSPRHDFRIEVILLTKKGTSFRSYSKNISSSGTLLEDEIPKEFFHRPFEVIFVNKFEKDPRKNRIHICGRIIGDLADPRRLVFIDNNEEIIEKIKKLILDYSGHKEKIKKSVG